MKKYKSNKGKATNNIQRDPIRLSADFSAETLQVRRKRHDIFKVMKGKNLQTRLPRKALIQLQERNQNFIDKQKLRELSTTKPALQHKRREQKRKGRKKTYKKTPIQLRKWQ